MLCRLVLAGRLLPTLVDKIVQETVSDVDPLEDPLEVPDVVKEAAVEHLDEQLGEAEHLLLSRAYLKLEWHLVGREKEGVLLLDMLQGATKPVHVLE